MKRSSLRDTIVGAFVLAGLAAIAFLSVRIGGVAVGSGYGLTLYASFDEIGGLSPRSKVTISGVKVGQVAGIELDEDYRAKVRLQLDPSLELPVDSSASIMTAGVLGNQYLSLQLGAEDDVLQDGDTISFTESAVILERLIGKLIHNTDVSEGS